ncbi:hypothetical protein SLS62_004472 [Diatrype stigma]|uniref:Uncharacterized protein n=1 Tax=Diatrype stigma TaxID=117547 RepID=A0AAN9V342_9PEZI
MTNNTTNTKNNGSGSGSGSGSNRSRPQSSPPQSSPSPPTPSAPPAAHQYYGEGGTPDLGGYDAHHDLYYGDGDGPAAWAARRRAAAAASAASNATQQTNGGTGAQEPQQQPERAHGASQDEAAERSTGPINSANGILGLSEGASLGSGSGAAEKTNDGEQQEGEKKQEASPEKPDQQHPFMIRSANDVPEPRAGTPSIFGNGFPTDEAQFRARSSTLTRSPAPSQARARAQGQGQGQGQGQAQRQIQARTRFPTRVPAITYPSPEAALAAARCTSRLLYTRDFSAPRGASGRRPPFLTYTAQQARHRAELRNRGTGNRVQSSISGNGDGIYGRGGHDLADRGRGRGRGRDRGRSHGSNAVNNTGYSGEGSAAQQQGLNGPPTGDHGIRPPPSPRALSRILDHSLFTDNGNNWDQNQLEESLRGYVDLAGNDDDDDDDNNNNDDDGDDHDIPKEYRRLELARSLAERRRPPPPPPQPPTRPSRARFPLSAMPPGYSGFRPSPTFGAPIPADEAMRWRRTGNVDVLNNRRACPCCGEIHICRGRPGPAAGNAEARTAPATSFTSTSTPPGPGTFAARTAAPAASFTSNSTPPSANAFSVAAAAATRQQRYPLSSHLCPAHNFMPPHVQENFQRQSRRLGLEELELKTALVAEAQHGRLARREEAGSGRGLGALLTWDGFGDEEGEDDGEKTRRSPSPAVTVVLASDRSGGSGGVSEHDNDERMRGRPWSREDRVENRAEGELQDRSVPYGGAPREGEASMSEYERARREAEWEDRMYDQNHYGGNPYADADLYYGISRMPSDDGDWDWDLDLSSDSDPVYYPDSDDELEGEVEDEERSNHDE